MVTSLRTAVVAALLAMTGVAQADRILTLDEALALARGHNRDLRVARARVAETSAVVDQARAAFLPTASARGTYTHNYKEVIFDKSLFTGATLGLAEVLRQNPASPQQAAAIGQYEQQTAAAIAAQPSIEIQKQEQLDGAVSATIPLVAAPAYYAYGAAKQNLHAVEATYDANEATVLVSVAQAYFAAAGTDELVLARLDAVGVAEETYNVAKARVGSDVANPVDVTRAETALVRAQQDLAEAENTRAATYRQLATLIGTRDAFRVQPTPAPPAEPGSTVDLVHVALATRPELAAERANIRAAEANSRSALFRWAPSLSGFANLRGFNYTGFSGDKYAWAVGLQLDWVIYDGGVRDALRHQANAQRAEAQARLEQLDDQISDEVANARGTLDTKRKAVAAAERSVALAKEALRLVRAQYEAGTAKQLDVLQAQDSLVTAAVALAQAHFDLSLADLQLRRAAGTFPERTPRRK
jgi:outer membrane protein TolC